jgi:hypothetical protein
MRLLGLSSLSSVALPTSSRSVERRGPRSLQSLHSQPSDEDSCRARQSRCQPVPLSEDWRGDRRRHCPRLGTIRPRASCCHAESGPRNAECDSLEIASGKVRPLHRRERTVATVARLKMSHPTTWIVPVQPAAVAMPCPRSSAHRAPAQSATSESDPDRMRSCARGSVSP